MSSFFKLHPTNATNAGLQVLNFAALGLACYDLMTNPQASKSEQTILMLAHLLNYMALEKDADMLLAAGSSYVNGIRLGMLVVLLTRQICQASLLLNVLSGALSVVGTFNPLLIDDRPSACSERPQQ